MFNIIKNSLKKIYSTVTSKLGGLFGRQEIDQETLKELELILIQADAGVTTTRRIMQSLTAQHKAGTIKAGDELKAALEKELYAIATKKSAPTKSDIILLVGINGSGKTTTAAKLAQKALNEGKKVLMVAADTFRAAAPEQLMQWAKNTNSAIELGTPGQDPASVVFAGCERFKNEGFDQLIIDTAGRLQTKVNLMKELEKIKRVVSKQLPERSICTYITLDAMLGQNSFEQAQLFNESTDVSGVILTKMDGTGKGGILFAVADQLDIPVAYITFGEGSETIKPFDPKQYVHDLVNA